MSRHLLLIVSLYLFAGVVARAGEFQSHVDYATGPNPVFVVVADFNGDAWANGTHSNLTTLAPMQTLAP